MTERISPRRFHEHGWRVLRDDACTYLATGTFANGVALVAAIAEIAGDRHPDIDLRPEGVTVRLGTHGPLPTEEDLVLAERISAVARELGASVDLDGLQAVQVAIDALVIPDVLPFWQAVLGYRKVDVADLIDPRLGGPPFWFQQMDAPRPQRNRIHIDLYVSQDEAEARVAAGLAAGGHLVSGAHAPEWWTLADAEGNEVDIAPWPDQD
ncbi:MAG TPA: VOC family protein [Actinomycetota bacterium]|jgi:4a-hydroxytetrahydrobiopterin dehydratase|nr:VOC family protein [Actinomycetota bacterium]